MPLFRIEINDLKRESLILNVRDENDFEYMVQNSTLPETDQQDLDLGEIVKLPLQRLPSNTQSLPSQVNH